MTTLLIFLAFQMSRCVILFTTLMIPFIAGPNAVLDVIAAHRWLGGFIIRTRPDNISIVSDAVLIDLSLHLTSLKCVKDQLTEFSFKVMSFRTSRPGIFRSEFSPHRLRIPLALCPTIFAALFVVDR